MLMLMAIAIDFGRLFYAYVAVQNAAKEGALYGSRNPLCVDNSNVACPDPINVQWHVENEASNLESGGTSLLETQVTCRDPGGALRQAINDCVHGDTYMVDVGYDFRLLTPLLSDFFGGGLYLGATEHAKVIGDAFDPSGLEALVWVDRANSENAGTITTECTPADSASSPGFYYAPCQNGLNVDQYLQFQQDRTITFKARIKNTGNIILTGIGYTFAVNGATISTPAGCDGRQQASVEPGEERRPGLLHLHPSGHGDRHRPREPERRHHRQWPRLRGADRRHERRGDSEGPPAPEVHGQHGRRSLPPRRRRLRAGRRWSPGLPERRPDPPATGSGAG